MPGVSTNAETQEHLEGPAVGNSVFPVRDVLLYEETEDALLRLQD